MDVMPGYRFYPTEEELVSFYLQKKIQGRRQDLNQVIPELYIYEFNPWDLPDFAGECCPKDTEQWFFFVPRQEKEVRGGRPNRLTTTGFWKATGSPGYVYSSDNRIIGAKRTMVFYKGRAPTGTKTQWKMNEYRAVDGESASPSSLSATPKLREEFSLCRVYIRSKCLRAFDRRPSSSSSSSSSTAAVSVTSTATVNQANDDHHIDHDRAATTYHDHYQNDHPMMERIITTSPDLSSSRDHASPNSQTFNQAHDHGHVDHDWAATSYHDHYQNDHPMMERIITTLPDLSSSRDHASPNSQTLNQAHDHRHVDHDWAATTYHEHHQNNHPMMERTITTSSNQSSSEAHANPNSQTFNQADHDHHNVYHDWAATTYHDHLQNNHPMMERLITTSPDQSSTRELANPNCDMGFDNNEDPWDFWEHLNLS